ncbi:MAG: hypothetical protein RLO81_15050 [Fulvivirga sp.]|uniref:hypothetical protein n=1 Tax=Fulvivirga sp. TaxID=1931237 RepID=UPI0032EF4AFF
MVLNSKNRTIIAGAAMLLTSVLLLWEHFHGGVASHYLLHDENMPKISNWWGLLCIPLATYLVLSKKEGSIQRSDWLFFIGGILFGAIITISFYNEPDLTGTLMLLSFGLALFMPLYRPEYYLGFVWSMAYGFGGVLPVVFGLIIIAIYAFEYLLIRRLALSLYRKF